MEHKWGQHHLIGSSFPWRRSWSILAAVVAMAVAGCSGHNQDVSPRSVNYYQKWALQPG